MKFDRETVPCVANLQLETWQEYMLFVGLEIRVVKNCDRGLENAARGPKPRVAFSNLRSQFITIRTYPKAVNNLFLELSQ